jgi:hypothetical protein
MLSEFDRDMEKLGGDHKTRRTAAIASLNVGGCLLHQAAGWGRTTVLGFCISPCPSPAIPRATRAEPRAVSPRRSPASRVRAAPVSCAGWPGPTIGVVWLSRSASGTRSAGGSRWIRGQGRCRETPARHAGRRITHQHPADRSRRRAIMIPDSG